MTNRDKSGVTKAPDFVASEGHEQFFYGLKDYRKCDNVTKNEDKTKVYQPTHSIKVDGLPCNRREFLKTLLKIRHDKMSLQNQRSKLGELYSRGRTQRHTKLHVERLVRKEGSYEENVKREKLLLADYIRPSNRRKIAIRIPSQLSSDGSKSSESIEGSDCTDNPRITETPESIDDATQTSYSILDDTVISDSMNMEKRIYNQDRDMPNMRSETNDDSDEEFDAVLDYIDNVRTQKDKMEGDKTARTTDGTNESFISSPSKRTIVVTLPNPTLDATPTFAVSYNNAQTQREFVGICKTYPEMYNLKLFDDVKEDFEKRKIDAREKRNRVGESVDLKKQHILYYGPRTLFTGTQSFDIKTQSDISVEQSGHQNEERTKARRRHELQQILENNDKFSPSSIPTIRANNSSTRILSIVGMSPGADHVTKSLPEVAETVSYRSIPRKTKSTFARKRSISKHEFHTPSKDGTGYCPRKISVISQDDAAQSESHEFSKTRKSDFKSIF